MTASNTVTDPHKPNKIKKQRKKKNRQKTGIDIKRFFFFLFIRIVLL